MKKVIGITIGIVLGLTLAVAVHAGRNSTGTYSLPAGNPVTTGTTIAVPWANNTFGDVASTLTASLDRDGKGGMRAPLKLTDGAVGAPALTFTNEPLSGLYRIGASNPAMSVSGSKRQEWTSTGTAITGTLAATGNTTVGGTLGVTGAETVGGAIDVTGAATVGGTLTANGLSNFYGVVSFGSPVNFYSSATFNSGAAVAANNIAFTSANPQAVTKTGGYLFVGTLDANPVTLSVNNGNVNWTLSSDGNLTRVTAAGTVTGLPSPSGASDAATKGYVDGLTTASTGTLGACQNSWAWGATARVWKVGRTAFLNVELAAPGSIGSPLQVCQLPAGFYPAATTTFSASSSAGSGAFTIDTGGLISVLSVNAGILNTTVRGSAVLLLP